MVVNCDREHALSLLLANHVLIQYFVDFSGDRKFSAALLTRGLLNLFSNDIVAKVHTLVANKDGRPCNQLSYLILAFATKRAIEQLTAVA
jgi:hypothetical protein